jgi:hypothetical protein
MMRGDGPRWMSGVLSVRFSLWCCGGGDVVDERGKWRGGGEGGKEGGGEIKHTSSTAMLFCAILNTIE